MESLTGSASSQQLRAWGGGDAYQQKHTHPHSLRHTTAIFLLKAGVDFATISQWLGHATMNTTMTYARADLDLKRQALMQVFPEILAPPRAGQMSSAAVNIVDWLSGCDASRPNIMWSWRAAKPGSPLGSCPSTPHNCGLHISRGSAGGTCRAWRWRLRGRGRGGRSAAAAPGRWCG
jgi:Phage integrase family